MCFYVFSVNDSQLDKNPICFALRVQAGVSERSCLLASLRKKGFWRRTDSSLKSTSKLLKLWTEKAEAYQRRKRLWILSVPRIMLLRQVLKDPSLFLFLNRCFAF